MPSLSQRARHFASRPSSDGFSGTAMQTPRVVAHGIWPEAGSCAYRPVMPVEESVLGALGEVFTPETRRNPHPLYHLLRSEAPMAYSEEMDEWVFTRWADCEAVLRDPR